MSIRQQEPRQGADIPRDKKPPPRTDLGAVDENQDASSVLYWKDVLLQP